MTNSVAEVVNQLNSSSDPARCNPGRYNAALFAAVADERSDS